MADRALSREANQIAARVAEILTDRGRVDEPFYTPISLAAKLAVTRRTVYTLLKKGAIRSYRVQNSVRIDPRDVDAYLEAHRAPIQEDAAAA